MITAAAWDLVSNKHAHESVSRSDLGRTQKWLQIKARLAQQQPSVTRFPNKEFCLSFDGNVCKSIGQHFSYDLLSKPAPDFRLLSLVML